MNTHPRKSLIKSHVLNVRISLRKFLRVKQVSLVIKSLNAWLKEVRKVCIDLNEISNLSDEMIMFLIILQSIQLLKAR